VLHYIPQHVQVSASMETASKMHIRSSSTGSGAEAGTSFAMAAAAAHFTIKNDSLPKPIWGENGTSLAMLQHAEAGKFEHGAAVTCHQDMSEAIIEETGHCPTCTLLNSGSDLLHARLSEIQAGVTIDKQNCNSLCLTDWTLVTIRLFQNQLKSLMGFPIKDCK
jgi:hypothetical protein